MTKILILDDEPLVGQVLEITFIKKGFQVLPLAMSVDEALSAIGTDAPDVALLDINLGDETSYPVADRLMQEKIPFCFFTAYQDTAVPERFQNIEIISKTTPRDQITERIRSSIGEASY